MINKLIEELTKRGLHIAACESLTGGLFAASITAVPGVSKAFVGSAVTYSNESKIALGVKKETVDNCGVISKECAKEMAVAASKFYNAEVTVSFTGNAGPEVMEGKEVGEVYIGILVKNLVKVYKLKLDGDRQKVREQCVNFAIKALVDTIAALD